MPRYVVALGASGPLAADAIGAGVRAAQARFTLCAASDVRRTIAAGGVTAMRFANACVVIESALASGALLRELHAIEALCGRVRGEKNSARALDLDLVWNIDGIAAS